MEQPGPARQSLPFYTPALLVRKGSFDSEISVEEE